MKTVNTYIHADKDRMWEVGAFIGLAGEPLMMFRHACSEVKVMLEVDETTGLAMIVAVDDRVVSK